MLNRVFKIILVLIVLGIAGYLRFDALDSNPMHADEATGAKILSERLGNKLYRFDPSHFHGPLLTTLTLPLVRARGELDWRALRSETLRWLPALAGLLTLMLLLFWRKVLGDGAVIWAMFFSATSPLLVTYSRTYIHEMILAFVALLTLSLWWIFCEKRSWFWFLPLGLGVGLMFSTKETFVISIGVWMIALMLLGLQYKNLREQVVERLKLPYSWCWLFLGVATAFVGSAWFYSDGFRHPEAIGDAYRTYFVYKTTSGHEKPWFYYLHLLAWPKEAGGRLWQESGIAIIFILGAAINLCTKPRLLDTPFYVARFMLYSAVGHVFAYSLISYKTPWLMVLPWLHVCIFTGYATALFCENARKFKLLCWALLLTLMVFQIQQSYRATHRYACDARNPNILVPSSKDVFQLEELVAKISRTQLWSENAMVAVLGSQYWPLPWYLKKMKRVGYWANGEGPSNLASLEMVIAMPPQAEKCGQELAQTHQFILYGLRDEFPMSCFIRKDIWLKYLELPE